MADGRKRSEPPTDSSSSSKFQKNELYAWYMVQEYPAVLLCTYVRVLYFKAPTFLRAAARTTSRTGSHRQSSGKIFIAAKLFGGLLERLRGSS